MGSWWDGLPHFQRQALAVAAAMLAITCAIGGLFLVAMMQAGRKQKARAAAEAEQAKVRGLLTPPHEPIARIWLKLTAFSIIIHKHNYGNTQGGNICTTLAGMCSRQPGKLVGSSSGARLRGAGCRRGSGAGSSRKLPLRRRLPLSGRPPQRSTRPAAGR